MPLCGGPPVAELGVLDKIAASTLERVKRWKHERPIEALKDQRLYGRLPRSLSRALLGPGPRVIAEVKFASPSEGFLRESVSASPREAARIAGSYLDAGAAVISVLTEENYFSGDPSYLAAVRHDRQDACLLMKDFFIDPYQFHLARSCGADAVLLIAALLGPRLPEMAASANALGLSALVEVHNEAEAEAALAFGADVVGVNNRDLRTLRTDLDIARRLAPLARRAGVAVAESGLRSRYQIEELGILGYKGFLIGTSLMKAPDPGAALAEFLKA